MTPKKTRYNLTISKEELDLLPVGTFNGEICLVTAIHEIDSAIQEISRHSVVGFDTETRPSFRKGEHHKVALIQLAIPNKVFLIRLHKVQLTDSIIAFFEEGKITKAGVGIENDIRALQELRPFKADGFAELSKMAREIGLHAGSLKKLTGIVLGLKISKSAQVSNWEISRYTEKQVRYAATDAWVCLALHNKLTTELQQMNR